MTPAELAQRTAAWMKLGAPDDALEACARAVHVLVAVLPVTQGRPTWREDVDLGAVMLTARLHRRRNSPAGVEALTEMGVSYVSRYDSDIARLLRIDAFMGPVAV